MDEGIKEQLNSLAKQMMTTGRQMFNMDMVGEQTGEMATHGKELMDASCKIQSWLKEAKA
jgi:hypothetical protein